MKYLMYLCLKELKIKQTNNEKTNDYHAGTCPYDDNANIRWGNGFEDKIIENLKSETIKALHPSPINHKYLIYR